MTSSLAHSSGQKAASIPTARAERPVLAYSVPDAGRAIGVSKTTVWRLIADKEIATFKLGCRTLIRADELRRFIDGKSLAA